MDDPIIMKREMTARQCFTNLSYINVFLTSDVIWQFNTFMDTISIDQNSHFVISAMTAPMSFAVIPKTLRIMTLDNSPYLVANNVIHSVLPILEFEAKTSDSKFITFSLDRNANTLNVKIERTIFDIYPTIFNTYESFCEQHNSSNSLKKQIQVTLNISNMFGINTSLDIHPLLKWFLAMGISIDDIILGWAPLEI